MKFIKKLFYNCYHFQIKVGNGDMPVFMAFVMILFGTYIYLASIGMLLAWLTPKIKLSTTAFSAVILTIAVGCIIYRNIIRKKQYEKIINNKQFGSMTSKIETTVFFVASILFLIGIFVLMWAKNNQFV